MKISNIVNRAIVFAHFNKNDEIDDYVLYYLKELNKNCRTLIFVSTSNIVDPSRKITLSNLVTEVIIRNNIGYDFYSYKTGFDYILNSGEIYDELIFINDSCIGPLFPLSDLFYDMSIRCNDFWGITQNSGHIQSYFMAFSKSVVSSQNFINFWSNFSVYTTKPEVILNGEIKLTQILAASGFNYSVYTKSIENNLRTTILKFIRILLNHLKGNKIFGISSLLFTKNELFDNTSLFWDELIKKKMPFLKKSVLRRNDISLKKVKKNLIKYSKYPTNNIDNITI